ncbi:MAG: hypothetical protein ACRDX8_04805 [Acidimicrobiales bacterium]
MEERPITIPEVMGAPRARQPTECFCAGTGTAPATAPVSTITHAGERFRLLAGEHREIALMALDRLVQIRAGRQPAPEGWLVPI